MKPDRHTIVPQRRRVRRTEDVLIQALQSKIAALEARKQRKAMKGDPNAKLASKLVRSLRKAEATFESSGRQDLANSAKAAAIALERSVVGEPAGG